MCLFLSSSAVGQTTATWNGTTGNWSDGTLWSTDPLFPNNGNGGNNYNAVINAGTVTLNQNITIEDLTLSGGTITGSNNLNVNSDLNWTGGRFSGSGTTTIGGGSISSTNTKFLDSRTLEIVGDVTWTNGEILPFSPSAFGTVRVESGATFTSSIGFPNRNLRVNLQVENGGRFLASSGGTFVSDVGQPAGTALINGVVELAPSAGLFMTGGSGNGIFKVGNNSTLIFELSNASEFQYTGEIALNNGIVQILIFSGPNIDFLLPSALTGVGTVTASTLVNTNTISPGNPLADKTGAILVNGDYEQTPAGKLSIDIEGFSSGQYDTLAITGSATLGGTLEVQVDPLLPLTAGAMIEVLTAGNTMSTEFVDVITTGTEDFFFAPVYTQFDVALLSFDEGDLDMNGDGVSTDDVDDFALALTDPDRYRDGPSPGYPFGHGASAQEAGDIDDDGDIDVDDIDDFAGLVGMTVSGLKHQIQLYSAQIPEPSALTLGLLIAACGACWRPNKLLQ